MRAPALASAQDALPPTRQRIRSLPRHRLHPPPGPPAKRGDVFSIRTITASGATSERPGCARSHPSAPVITVRPLRDSELRLRLTASSFLGPTCRSLQQRTRPWEDRIERNDDGIVDGVAITGRLNHSLPCFHYRRMIVELTSAGDCLWRALGSVPSGSQHFENRVIAHRGNAIDLCTIQNGLHKNC